MSKKIVIVMPFYDRQWQLNKTLNSILFSAYDNFSVVIVDDCSPKKIVLPSVNIPIKVIRLENRISTNPASNFNIGIQEALNCKADVIIIQSPECYYTGDVISRASLVKDNEYLSFACFRLDMPTTFKNHDINTLAQMPFIEPTSDPGTEGVNMWWNHSIWQPNAFHWCCAITAENLVKLNGFDESFSFGYGWEDGYFISQVKILGLDVKIIDEPFVVHQWHTQRHYSEDMGLLTMRNSMIYARLMLENNYRAKHILTNDLAWPIEDGV